MKFFDVVCVSLMRISPRVVAFVVAVVVVVVVVVGEDDVRLLTKIPADVKRKGWGR